MLSMPEVHLHEKVLQHLLTLPFEVLEPNPIEPVTFSGHRSRLHWPVYWSRLTHSQKESRIISRKISGIRLAADWASNH